MNKWCACMAAAFAIGCFIAEGADFIFVNLDGSGEGLNDPTPAPPVGGNPGTTVGAQRLAALEKVGEIWGRYLISPVPIRVEVSFDPLGEFTLAAAAPKDVELNFTNAPVANTVYPVALANSLAQRDLQPFRNDISVTVSSDANFYLGFNQDFNPVTAPGSNFIDVMLHEVAHGLGFISYVNENTGTHIEGVPDIFTTLIFDLARNAAWPSLTASQRAASAVSGDNLVWDGPFTTAGANQVLELQSGRSSFVVDAVLPDLTLLADVAYANSSIGVRIPGKGISGMLVVTDDGSGATSTLACQDIVNVAEVAGNIAFVRRGSCNFDDKVFHAQEAGAAAVVIANNVEGALVSAGGDGIVDGELVDITVPVLFISMEDGDALEAASPGVRLEISQRQGARAGSTAGKVNLHAPNPVESGSSVSHWTRDTSPDLLMEPNINVDLDRRLDLTLTMMRDIGWEVVDIPFPNESYAIWAARVFDAGETLTAETDDADGDGATNLEEYFFGSLPDDAASRHFPEFSLEDGEPRLEIVVSTPPADLMYVIETSETLDGFDAAVPGVEIRMLSREQIVGKTERLVFGFVSPPGKLFARVRVEKKDP